MTVGTGSFDSLVNHCLRLFQYDYENEVTIQFGEMGKLSVSSSVELVPYIKNLQVENYDFVICHCGAGIVNELIKSATPFIAVPNLSRFDDHQLDLAKAVEKIAPEAICWKIEKLTAERLARHSMAPVPQRLSELFNTKNFAEYLTNEEATKINFNGFGLGNCLMKLSGSIISKEKVLCLDFRGAEISPNARDCPEHTVSFMLNTLSKLDVSVQVLFPNKFLNICNRNPFLRRVTRRLFYGAKLETYGVMLPVPKSIGPVIDRIAIHFRGGDFKRQSDVSKYALMDENYYKSALSIIKTEVSSKYQISVVTDDEPELPKFLKQFEVEKFKNDTDAWQFLNESKYVICANSSFSISAALIGYENKKIIIPSDSNRLYEIGNQEQIIST